MSTLCRNRNFPVILTLAFLFTIATITNLELFSTKIEHTLTSGTSNVNLTVHTYIETQLHHNKPIKNSIKPFISEKNKALAYERFMNGRANIIYFHARKAAGTAVSQWLGSLLRQQGLGNTKVERHEAFPIWNGNKRHRRNPIQDKMTNNATDSIFVITLRHPIDRILSHYEFEWKWGCNACCHTNSDIIQQPLNDTNDEYINMNGTNYLQTDMIDQWWVTDGACRRMDIKYKHKFANIEFEDLLKRIERFEMKTSKGCHTAFGMSVYLDNYYLWMFCCNTPKCSIKKDFIDTGKIEQCYKDSIAKIQSMDIIILTEWMNDIRINLFVNKRFERKWRKITGLNDRNFVRVRAKPYPHKEKRRGSNYMVNAWSYNKLREWNEWDLRFYEYCKELLYRKTETIWNQNTVLLFGNGTDET